MVCSNQIDRRYCFKMCATDRNEMTSELSYLMSPKCGSSECKNIHLQLQCMLDV